MKNFNEYFLMNDGDIVEYVKAKTDVFDADDNLISKEIGDGNLNYVYRVTNEKDGRTVILKQAGSALRISDEMHLPVDRGKIESDILLIQNKYADGYVPDVYLYDEIMCVIVMEDMINHSMMRTALIQHDTFEKFSEQISSFMVNTLLSTSDIVMDHKEKKVLVKKFINPELCEITEDLVFTEPYLDNNNRNNALKENLDFIKKEIYQDKALKLKAAQCKIDFMNNAQSLIHGDLHTGSIFINDEHLFVFDPEFAFYGPAGYDVGNVIANMMFAWANGDASISNEKEKENFCGWVLSSVEETIDLFCEKFKVEYSKSAKDAILMTEGYCETYLASILKDTASYAGTELIRRIVGMAKVKDITSINDIDKRVRAERILLTYAKKLMLENDVFVNGKVYIDKFEDSICEID